jgi:hypothetical protein
LGPRRCRGDPRSSVGRTDARCRQA